MLCIRSSVLSWQAFESALRFSNCFNVSVHATRLRVGPTPNSRNVNFVASGWHLNSFTCTEDVCQLTPRRDVGRGNATGQKNPLTGRRTKQVALRCPADSVSSTPKPIGRHLPAPDIGNRVARPPVIRNITSLNKERSDALVRTAVFPRMNVTFDPIGAGIHRRQGRWLPAFTPMQTVISRWVKVYTHSGAAMIEPISVATAASAGWNSEAHSAVCKTGYFSNFV